MKVKGKLSGIEGSNSKKVSFSNILKRRGSASSSNQTKTSGNSSKQGSSEEIKPFSPSASQLASYMSMIRPSSYQTERRQGITKNPELLPSIPTYGVKYNSPVTSQEISRLSSNTISEGNSQLKFITKRLRENGEYMSPLAFQMREAQSNNALNALKRYSRNARNK
jgi:hypothetical protein